MGLSHGCPVANLNTGASLVDELNIKEHLREARALDLALNVNYEAMKNPVMVTIYM